MIVLRCKLNRFHRAVFVNRNLSSNAKQLSFSLSGSGWLMPYHLGVMETFKHRKLINDKTIVAGTSGGSLVALLAVSDLSAEVALNTMISLSTNDDFKKDMVVGLKNYVRPLLPTDVLERCNGRLHVTTTIVWPPKNVTLDVTIVSHFNSTEHLLDCVSASCFIPYYTASSLTTTIAEYPGEHHVDGGVFAYMPPVGEVRVSALPREIVPKVLFGPCDICPAWNDYPIPQLLKWSLFPPPEKELRGLYEKGAMAAEKWILESEKKEQLLV
jgi:hypothetical protein